jgi:hypothetical protein
LTGEALLNYEYFHTGAGKDSECWKANNGGSQQDPEPNTVVANILPGDLSGTVSGTGSFLPGTDVTLTAPATIGGYTFKGWTVNSPADLVYTETGNTLSFVMPSVGVSVTANYNAPAPKFEVTIIKDCEDGADGTFTGDGFYEEGDEVTASATPGTYNYYDYWEMKWKTGTYKYKWYERTKTYGSNQWTERASNSDYVFTMPAKDVELKVKFYKYESL